MSLSEVSVDDVRPLFGPESGGTRVTITGQYVSTVTAVYIGQHKRYPDMDRLVLHSTEMYQVLRLQVQVQVQVLQTCTRVVECKYKHCKSVTQTRFYHHIVS